METKIPMPSFDSTPGAGRGRSGCSRAPARILETPNSLQTRHVSDSAFHHSRILDLLVLGELPIERGETDLQQFRRLLLVPSGVRQGPVQISQFLFTQERFEWPQRSTGRRLDG